jgi:serine/threonine-protein kinase
VYAVFLLTGRPPFVEGTAVHRMLAHLREEPRPVESLRKDLPAGLGKVLRKLMAKRPENRYQSPAEFVERLTGVLGGVGPRTTP